MEQILHQSSGTAAYRRLYFHAVDATDGITPEPGLTGAGRISKNGAATAASTNNIVEIDAANMPGRYYVELTAAEVDTLGKVVFRYKNPACAEVIVLGVVVAYDPFAAATTPPTAADIADAVFDEATAGHTTAGTFGERITRIPNVAAGANGGLPTVDASNRIAGIQGTINNLNNLDVALSVIAAYVDTEITDIRNRLPAALVGGRMDSNASAVNGSATAAAAMALAAAAIVSGACIAGSTTTVTNTGLASATNDQYKDRWLFFTSGVNAGTAKQITGYNGATKAITTAAFPAAAANGDTFVIC